MDIYEYCQRSAVCGIPRKELKEILEYRSESFFLKKVSNNLLLVPENNDGKDKLEHGYPRIIKCAREYYQKPGETLHINTNNAFIACDQVREAFFGNTLMVARNECRHCHLTAMRLVGEGKLETRQIKKKK